MKKNKRITFFFNALLFSASIILILMSLLGFIAVHLSLWDKTKYSFSFSPTGINNYLSALGEFKTLFTATVATIAAYYGLWRFQAAADQNRDKFKQDRFSEWKIVLEVRSIEIEKSDPYMKREFIRVRYNLFNELFDLNFNISNKVELTRVFQKIFKEMTDFFESQNNRHIGMGGVYPNDRYSYSFDSFRFLFIGCVDKVYPAIVADLQTLYVATLPNTRTIDSGSYQAASRNYLQVKSN